MIGPRNLIFCESTEPIAIIGSFYVPKERAAISAGDVQGDGGASPTSKIWLCITKTLLAQ